MGSTLSPSESFLFSGWGPAFDQFPANINISLTEVEKLVRMVGRCIISGDGMNMSHSRGCWRSTANSGLSLFWPAATASEASADRSTAFTDREGWEAARGLGVIGRPRARGLCFFPRRV